MVSLVADVRLTYKIAGLEIEKEPPEYKGPSSVQDAVGKASRRALLRAGSLFPQGDAAATAATLEGMMVGLSKRSVGLHSLTSIRPRVPDDAAADAEAPPGSRHSYARLLAPRCVRFVRVRDEL